MISKLKKFYRQLFKGQIFIIKAGGKIITDKTARENLIINIKELTEDGIKVLLIYGGGEAIDIALKEAGLTTEKIDGRRISSAAAIKIIKKTLAGDLGFKLSESLVKHNLSGSVLNAIPPHWVKANRRDNYAGTLRFDGTLGTITPKNIDMDFSGTSLMICPCLAFTDDGTALNINADNVAVQLACDMKAQKLVFMTDIDGVKVNRDFVSVLTGREIKQLIADKIVTGGMRVKLENCLDALRAGVKRIHILNGFRKNALHDEVYTASGAGTMIVKTDEKETYETQERAKL